MINAMRIPAIIWFTPRVPQVRTCFPTVVGLSHLATTGTQALFEILNGLQAEGGRDGDQ